MSPPYYPQVPTNYQPLLTEVNGKWNDFQKKDVPLWWDQVAGEMPSSARTEHYNWAKNVPDLEEWVGSVNFQTLGSYQYTLENKDWVRGVEIRRTDIDDNQIGRDFWMQLEGLSKAAKKLPDQQMAAALHAGSSYTGWDGAAFFSASHPTGGGWAGSSTVNQQNYWSSSTPLTFDNLNLVYQTMVNYRNDEGRPIGIMPNVLLVPPQLMTLAKRLTGDTLADQTVTGITMVGNQPNPLAHTFKVVVAPELAQYSTTAWYLLDTNKPIMPMIWQNRQDTQLNSLTSNTDYPVFVQNKFQFTAYRRGAAGYGMWYCIAKAVG